MRQLGLALCLALGLGALGLWLAREAPAPAADELGAAGTVPAAAERGADAAPEDVGNTLASVPARTLVEPDAPLETDPLRTLPPGRLRGRVVDDRGRPLPDAAVTVVCDGDDAPTIVRTGVDGGFALENLPPVHVDVGAAHDATTIDVRSESHVGVAFEWSADAPADSDPRVFAVIALTRAAHDALTVRVVDETGAPRADVTVALFEDGDGPARESSEPSQTGPEATTDENGIAMIRFHERGARFVMIKDRRVPAERTPWFTLDPATDAVVHELRIPVAATLRGRLRRRGTDVVGHARLVLERDDGIRQATWTEDATSATPGDIAELRNLDPGVWHARLWIERGDAGPELVRDLGALTLGAGETRELDASSSSLR